MNKVRATAFVRPADERTAIVVMGVSAAGKSSVAAALAEELELAWLDADDLHPTANVDKMASGIPLSDEDRWPWLDAVGTELDRRADAGGIVVACSCLRRVYRDRLRTRAPDAVFVHLTGTPRLLASRAAARANHFMPPGLLASQIALLEPLESDEAGVVVDVTPPTAAVVESALRWVRARVARA